jgi:hypothetical protein
LFNCDFPEVILFEIRHRRPRLFSMISKSLWQILFRRKRHGELSRFEISEDTEKKSRKRIYLTPISRNTPYNRMKKQWAVSSHPFLVQFQIVLLPISRSHSRTLGQNYEFGEFGCMCGIGDLDRAGVFARGDGS